MGPPRPAEGGGSNLVRGAEEVSAGEAKSVSGSVGTEALIGARAVLGFQQRLVSKPGFSVRACNPPGHSLQRQLGGGMPAGRWGQQPLGDQVTQRRGDGETGGPGWGLGGLRPGGTGPSAEVDGCPWQGDLSRSRAGGQGGESDCGGAGRCPGARRRECGRRRARVSAGPEVWPGAGGCPGPGAFCWE